MTLQDILEADCKRSFLTRGQRKTIRDAIGEINRLRTENIDLQEEVARWEQFDPDYYQG